jgi:phage I-like protein
MSAEQLVSSHAVTLPAGEAPRRIHLIPAGEFSGRDGRGPYRLDAQAVLAAFRRAAMRDGYEADGDIPIPIDYEHQGILAAENGQPAPAAGWITALQATDAGIWGTVEWTQKAAAMIEAKEYRFLSPVFRHTRDGRVIALDSAALTNQPNLTLTALNRKHGAEDRDQNQPIMKGRSMELDETTVARLSQVLGTALNTPEDVKTALHHFEAREIGAMRVALALPDSSTVTDVLAAAMKRIAKPDDAAAALLQAEYQRAAARLAALEKEREDARVSSEVGAALAAHKIAPASREWAESYCRKDAEGFAQFVRNAIPVLDDGKKTAHTRNAPPDADGKHPLLQDLETRFKT